MDTDAPRRLDQPAPFIVIGLVAIACLIRVLPHPWNFAPMGAVSVFAGAALGPRRGTLLALAAIIATDLAVGLHSLTWATWGSFALVAAAAGRWMSPSPGVRSTVGAGLASATTFFVVTNAAVWLEGLLYPRTLEGLMACYAAAIPFFRATVISDVLYCGLLFGCFALARRRILSPAASDRSS